MGTNYYWREQQCKSCKRYAEVHVGKSSAGWCFLFRIHEHRLMAEDNPEWGYDPESPFGYPVLSRDDWRGVFTSRTGALFDEYGQEVTDPLAWLDGLEAPDAEQIRLEDARMRSWHSEPYQRDPEGFRTQTREFS